MYFQHFQNKEEMELSTTVMFHSLNSSANISAVDVTGNSSVNFNTSVLYFNETHDNETAINNKLSIFNSYYSNELKQLLHVIIIPILFVFGTYGNAVSFYCMRRGSLREVSTCFYMAILAVADTREYLFCDTNK